MRKAAVGYIVVLGLAALVCLVRPRSTDWDMVMYLSLVQQKHNPAAAYAELQRSIPHQAYQILTGETGASGQYGTDGKSIYLRDMASSPDHFMQQTPLYAVKPLYIAAVWLLWKAGLSLFFAMHAVSAMAYFMTGWIVWLWTTKHLVGWTAFLAASTLALQPFLLQLARAPLPDALGLSLQMMGAYLIWERDRKAVGAGLLLLSILARPDAVLFCLLLFASLRMFVPMVGAVAVYLANNYFAHSYGWAKLFYHTFVHLLPAPKQAVVHVGPGLYFHVLAANTQHLVLNDTLLFLVFALGAWGLRAQWELRGPVLVCLATIVLHQLAFPVMFAFDADRFYAVEYLIVLLFAAQAFLSGRAPGQCGEEGGA